MVDLDLQIKNIQDKLQQLLKRQHLLQKENQRLQKELEKATAAGVEKDNMLQGFQQQLDALRPGSSNFNAGEKAALEKRINQYLKEIDKCLALLNP